MQVCERVISACVCERVISACVCERVSPCCRPQVSRIYSDRLRHSLLGKLPVICLRRLAVRQHMES